MTTNGYLAAKPRYEILDGLRGVAAIFVVIFHLFEPYSGVSANQIINHGYLAVDFFFVLSGFVVGYAYDDRWNKMSLKGFIKRRLIRLHPMVIMGTTIGACFFFFSLGNYTSEFAPLWNIILAFIMACFMIPCGKSLDIRGWGEMNSFNGPNWTLTWEYLANILYALIFRRLPKAILAILLGAAAICTIDLCLNMNIFGLLTEGRNHQMYTVIGGWSLTTEQLYIGATRLLYPFLCGLLISRIGKFVSVKRSFWICSIILIGIFSIPCIGGEGSILNGYYNATAIMIIFPLVVIIGAGGKISGKKSINVCKFLGDISYPLYITHYPLMYTQFNWVWSHKDAPLYTHIMVAVGCFVLSLGIAYACMKLYDKPVRKWLTEKFLTK